eukprot:CAMPEP_0194329480 /NCGR_PEP_ID=MMETSP0171-20130528/48476_1 /TAXON_ID=218684 /ORGANISM="Corethron pennatum, Strain L29A3" /LENGTH=266 /DNA_ID=CAMNT_0039090233 /DNA_START=142 /DNA_END=942 /DNA_ORIENTATION=-
MDCLNPQISGLDPAKDVPTMVLISGYPDTSDSWKRLTPHFEKTHHIIALNLPDYHKSVLSKTWGYSFPEMVTLLALAIEPHYKRGSPVHLVGHDWGSYVCQLYVRKLPDTVSKFVLLDVGKGDGKGPFLLQMSYMLWLAFSFLMSRISSTVSILLITVYPWKIIGPTYDTNAPSTIPSMKAHLAYPYAHIFRAAFKGELPDASFESPVPQLFLYGKKKRCKYHSNSYLDYLSKQAKCDWKEFENDGHWLHWSSHDAVSKKMKEFFA